MLSPLAGLNRSHWFVNTSQAGRGLELSYSRSYPDSSLNRRNSNSSDGCVKYINAVSTVLTYATHQVPSPFRCKRELRSSGVAKPKARLCEPWVVVVGYFRAAKRRQRVNG